MPGEVGPLAQGHMAAHTELGFQFAVTTCQGHWRLEEDSATVGATRPIWHGRAQALSRTQQVITETSVHQDVMQVWGN